MTRTPALTSSRWASSAKERTEDPGGVSGSTGAALDGVQNLSQVSVLLRVMVL
jgi:hypothetical protein